MSEPYNGSEPVLSGFMDKVTLSGNTRTIYDPRAIDFLIKYKDIRSTLEKRDYEKEYKLKIQLDY